MKFMYNWLSVLIAVFLFPSLGYSQAWTLTNCSSPLGVTTYGPINSSTTANSTNRTASIYPASQLSAISGGILSSMYFNRVSTGGTMNASPNFKLYLYETTNLDFGTGALDWATAISGATLVFDGDPSTIVGSTSGWKAFPLIAPYTYTGNNLVVLMECLNSTATTSSITWLYEYSTTCSPNSNTTKYVNTTTGVLGTSLSTSNLRRPIIGFDFTLPGCNNPAVGGTTNASVASPYCPSTAVTFSVSGATTGAGLTYQWEYAPDNVTFAPISGATSDIYATTITSAGAYRRTTICSGGTPASSSTYLADLNVETIPYTQAFASYLPAGCWVEYAGLLGSPTTFSSLTTSLWSVDGFANVGTTGAARCNITGTATDEWLISSSFNLTGNQQLEFNLALTTSGGTVATTLGADDKFQVVISTDNGATWSAANVLQTWDSTTPISNTGQNVIINLSSYSGLVRFGFYCESTVTNVTSDLHIDNMLVQDIPSCLRPSATAATSITTTSATLNWSAPSILPTSYEWKLVANGAGSAGTALFSGIEAPTATSANVTGLTGATVYNMWIRSICSGGNSIWDGPIVLGTIPANDECSGALSLTTQAWNGGVCSSSTNVSTVGSTQSAESSTCSTTNINDDVWFTFEATSSTHVFTFSNMVAVTGTATGLGMDMFTGTCGALTAVTGACSSTFGSAGAGNRVVSGLTRGTIYVLRLFTGGVSNSATFDFCITEGPDMTLNSSAVTQLITTTSAGAGEQNAQVLRITAVVSGFNNPVEITSLDFNTNGTTNVADLTNAKVYYTGTSSVFSTAVPFGTLGTAPSGAFTINGSQFLTNSSTTTTGTNTHNFWLTYDLDCGATNGNLIDGECSQINTLATTTPAPTGTRTITALSSYQTVAAGNWVDVAVWACGVPPLGVATSVVINNPVVLTSNVDVNANVTVTGTGSLDVGGFNFTLGDIATNDGGNKIFTIDGGLSLTSGTIKVNGAMKINTSGSFTMSGGELILDPQGSGGNITGTTIHTFDSRSNALTLSGGTITVVDPPFTNSTGHYSFYYLSSLGPVFANNLIRFGDGVSTSVGGGANSSLRLYPGSTTANRFYFYDIEFKGGGANHNITNLYDIVATNSMTVDAGATVGPLSDDIWVHKSLVNNGTMLLSSTTYALYLAEHAASGAVPSNNVVSITGSGVYVDAAASPISNMKRLYVDNTSGTPIDLPANFYSGSGLSSVANNFTIQNGILRLASASDIFVMGATSTATSNVYTVNNGGRIIGGLTRWFGTTVQDRFFDVGTATASYRMTFTPSATMGTAGFLTASWFPGTPGTSGLPLMVGGVDITDVSPTGSWLFDAGGGFALGAATYTMTVDASNYRQIDGITPITDLANIRLLKRTNSSTPWEVQAGASYPAPTTLTAVSASGLNTFSQFAIGGAAAALPVELLSFTGNALSKTNQLAWKTATEENVAHFELERSVDGRTGFVMVSTVKAVGNSTTTQTYAAEDKQPVALGYYRLKMVDLDGTFEYSPMITISRKDKGLRFVNVYPVPMVDQVTIAFEVEDAKEVSIMVSDITGRIVQLTQISAQKGLNEQSVSMGSLPAGTYVITIHDGQEQQFVRITKQ